MSDPALPLSPLQRTLAPFRPVVFPYARFGGTLLLGLAAALLFQFLNVPLPWLLGPMCACTLAVLLGAQVSAPSAVRPAMISIVGVMLGSSVTADLLGRIPQWGLTIGIMSALLFVAGIIGVVWYRVVAGMDRVTAFYAGMPGGLIEMSTIGEERGGDGRMISLVHSARILVIVSTVPFLVQLIEGVNLGPRQASTPSIVDAPAMAYVWLIGTAVLGSLLGPLLRLPAAHLFGPMLLSAAVHATGLTDFKIPREIVWGAQLLIGCVTGCRFLGWEKTLILKILAHCFCATSLILAVTLGFAYATAQYLNTKIATPLLAFAPAGIAEMSLVAMALHLDAAFIMVHQMLRIGLTSFSAAIVFKLIGWGKDNSDSPAA